jgi:tetratricopeptide (TPR) repeat protein
VPPKIAGLSSPLLVVAGLSCAHADSGTECSSANVDHTIRNCSAIIEHRAGRSSAADAYVSRAIAHWAKGAYQRAAADSNQAIRLGSKSALAHLMRGILSDDGGDHRAALADFTRAIEIKSSTAAFYNRATSYLALADHARAVADFDQALAGEAPMPQAFVNRGLAHLALGHWDMALADAQRGASLLPGSPLAQAILTRVLVATGQTRDRPQLTLTYGPRGSLAFFPASKVLLAQPVPATRPPALADPPSAQPPTSEPPAAARTPTVSLPPTIHQTLLPPPMSLQGRIAACIRLWNGSAHINRSEWAGTCERFERGFERPNGKHVLTSGQSRPYAR